MASTAGQCRYQCAKSRTTGSPQDEHRTPIEDQRNDRYHNALENYLNRKVGKRRLGAMGSVQHSINRSIDYQRPARYKFFYVNWVEF
jgi:hypothetical protein